jgi:organic radical activating enzyme
MESKVLHQYVNGNVTVTVHENGTKVREWEGEQHVDYPESCDLKVTQYCDLDSVCVFCHEMSNKQGKHGDLDLILKIWENQLPGTELAIGGGNPLAHPDIDQFLHTMSSRGIIPNLTVNSLHMKRHAKQLQELQKTKSIYGLGISYRGEKYLDSLPEDLDYSNTVFHMILGLDAYKDAKAIIDWSKKRKVEPKILLLGYKQFGNGVKHYSEDLQKRINRWKAYLALLMQQDGLTLSFDNLAIKQLDLEKFMTPEEWQLLYQGPDQTHTFYVDAIEKTVAGTSTSSERFSIGPDDTVQTIFNKVKIDWV